MSKEKTTAMYLAASISTILVASLVRTSSAAAIGGSLVQRELPHVPWPSVPAVPNPFDAVKGWVNGAQTGANTFVNGVADKVNNAAHNVQDAAHNVAGSVETAANNVQNAGHSVADSFTFVPSKSTCPLIIQKTPWEKYLGIAPYVQALNKPCPWKVMRPKLVLPLCSVSFNTEESNANMDILLRTSSLTYLTLSNAAVAVWRQ